MRKKTGLVIAVTVFTIGLGFLSLKSLQQKKAPSA
jgi:hypothetical protein